MACVKFGVLFGFILLCHPGDADKKHKDIIETPPEIFPTDKSSYNIISKNETLLHNASKTTPPEIFPEEGSNYTFINNSSILETLKHSDDDIRGNFTEAKDLLKRYETKHVHEGIDVQSSTLSTIEVSVTDDPEMDVEEVQDESKSEDGKYNSTRVNVHGRRDSSKLSMYEGQTAAIVASVFAIIAIFVYVSLLLWRRYLEQRYGTREMLINEEDYQSYNDIKNFEL